MKERARNRARRRNVSEDRKGAYYLGMALMVVGALLFFSTFISSALHFGDFTDFENRTRSMAVRSLTGMGLLIVGGLIRGVGAKGLACDHLNEEDSKFCQECGAPMRA